MVKPKILVIVGSTASGKTTLAIKLAKKLGGEIVSADSRQIYRGMDVGTAKAVRQNLKLKMKNEKLWSKVKSDRNNYLSGGIVHHLLDIRNPDEDYTVADYKRDAVKAIRAILRKGKLPILVGGTGLYVKSVVENLDIPSVEAQPAIRKKLELGLQRKGLEQLFKKLVVLDPEAVYVVDPHNPRRVIRALEVALSTGKPFTAQRKKNKPLFDPCIIGVAMPNEKLRIKIEKRVNEMMHDGLVEETQSLYKKYGRVKALEAIGYREIIDYLDGKISLEEAVRQIKMNTWHYAKRQMTWFKKDLRVTWISPAGIAAWLSRKFF